MCFQRSLPHPSTPTSNLGQVRATQYILACSLSPSPSRAHLEFKKRTLSVGRAPEGGSGLRKGLEKVTWGPGQQASGPFGCSQGSSLFWDSIRVSHSGDTCLYHVRSFSQINFVIWSISDTNEWKENWLQGQADGFEFQLCPQLCIILSSHLTHPSLRILPQNMRIITYITRMV